MSVHGLIFVIVVVMMIAILASLASGMFFLISDRKRTPRTVKALTIRIGISIILFVFLIVAFMMGWIKPHGLMG